MFYSILKKASLIVSPAIAMATHMRNGANDAQYDIAINSAFIQNGPRDNFPLQTHVVMDINRAPDNLPRDLSG